MKNSLLPKALFSKYWELPLLAGICLITAEPVSAQKKKTNNKRMGAVQSGNYRNVFLEAGYSQAGIDQKGAKAYYDVFEGRNKVLVQPDAFECKIPVNKAAVKIVIKPIRSFSNAENIVILNRPYRFKQLVFISYAVA